MGRRLLNVISVMSGAFCIGAVVCCAFSYATPSSFPVLSRVTDAQVHSAAGRLVIVRLWSGPGEGIILGRIEVVRMNGQRIKMSPRLSEERAQQLTASGEHFDFVHSSIVYHAPALQNGFGFSSDRFWNSRTTGFWYVVIPYWAPIVAAALFPVIRFAILARQKLRSMDRTDHHLCVRCGYDLRASSDRCPECGEATASIALSVGRNSTQS